jgi:hypothetical protein
VGQSVGAKLDHLEFDELSRSSQHRRALTFHKVEFFISLSLNAKFLPRNANVAIDPTGQCFVTTSNVLSDVLMHLDFGEINSFTISASRSL